MQKNLSMHTFTTRFYILLHDFIFYYMISYFHCTILYFYYTVHFFTTVVFWFGLVWFGLVWFGLVWSSSLYTSSITYVWFGLYIHLQSHTYVRMHASSRWTGLCSG
jgi:hypothetical protein